MSVDPTLDLRKRVKAATREYDAVVQFHESWRVAANDGDLHERVSHSFAGQTFLIVRQALRREMLLGLVRIWDKQSRSIEIRLIADDLENPAILGSLLPDRPEYAEARACAVQAATIIRKYEVNGPHHPTLKTLRALRNQELAHHQLGKVSSALVIGQKIDDAAQELYDDTSKLIRLLMHVVERTAYDPRETAEVYNFYAKKFWASVTGESRHAPCGQN